MSESHEMLAATLSPVLDEVKDLMKSRKIQVGGTTFELEFYLGGDLKVVCHYMCYIELIQTLFCTVFATISRIRAG